MSTRAHIPHVQRGFTLVELMVSMALSLLLMLIIAEVFVTSKETYRTVEQMSRVQENARFAVSQMSRVVRMASFITDPLGNRGTIFPALAPALAGTDGATGAADEITVRYQGSGTPTADGTVIDCLGNEIVGDTLSVNRYYIAAGANGSTSLFCDTTGSAIGNFQVELISNVEQMQVMYGEDTDADFSANRYVVRASVANMDSVVSVRIAILFTTDDNVATALDARTYTLLNETYNPVDDRRVRRAYTTTVTLRNRAQ
jgi:type IV pilus assembly protein PilW